mmetsp:Transcript_172/g.241  ORF Transcript_172/g.241 Transcript_172/m.241 type:complete len:80 (-) Transcript_172:25-264(-)
MHSRILFCLSTPTFKSLGAQTAADLPSTPPVVSPPVFLVLHTTLYDECFTTLMRILLRMLLNKGRGTEWAVFEDGGGDA